ncbi:MAG: hypothetical protein JXR36_08385 [Bacteroidales bacterium]|nr:hypothetical protein [Bacteroidales bacterium]
MKKLAIILTIVAATAMIFSSCGKYDEGPAFSLLTKKARITGTWTLSEMTANDSVQDITGVTMKYTLEKDGTGSGEFGWGGLTFTSDIEWEFDDTKENLRVKSKDPITGEWDTEWAESKIIRLTNSECWMEETDTEGGLEIVTVTKMVKE